MSYPFQLSQEEHEAVYQEIEAHYLPNSEPQEQPRAIITGGQPGSGKSGITDLAKAELFDQGGYVLIDADLLREESRLYKPAMMHDDRTAANMTHPDAGAWAGRLTMVAAEGRRNLIIDQTSKDPDALEGLAMRLKDAGYRVELRVMSVNEKFSEQRIHTRYESMKEAAGFGRFSTKDNHDIAYAGVAATIERVEQNKPVDGLRIYDKEHQVLKDNQLQGGEWINAPDAAKIMHAERERPLSLDERRELAAGYDKLAKMIKAPARQAAPEERAAIEELRAAAHKSVAVVEAKAAAFEETTRNYQNDDVGMDSIIRKGALIETELRHQEYASLTLSSEQIKDIAAKDLEDFSFLQGKPEQQKLAVMMGGMMGDPAYRTAIREQANSDLDASIAAANTIEAQAEITISNSKSRDQDMEV